MNVAKSVLRMQCAPFPLRAQRVVGRGGEAPTCALALPQLPATGLADARHPPHRFAGGGKRSEGVAP